MNIGLGDAGVYSHMPGIWRSYHGGCNWWLEAFHEKQAKASLQAKLQRRHGRGVHHMTGPCAPALTSHRNASVTVLKTRLTPSQSDPPSFLRVRKIPLTRLYVGGAAPRDYPAPLEVALNECSKRAMKRNAYGTTSRLRRLDHARATRF